MLVEPNLCYVDRSCMLTLSYSLIWYMHAMFEPLSYFDLILCDKLLLICLGTGWMEFSRT